MDVVYSDSFDNEANWNKGGGWQFITNGSTPNLWGTGNIAYINAGDGKYNKPQTLKTVSNIDLSEYKTVLLQFNTDVSCVKRVNQRSYVIVTNETGYSYYVWSKCKSSYDGIVQIDISKLVAGNKSISLTFQYQSNKKNSNCWWEVDDVMVFGNKSDVAPWSTLYLDASSYTVDENAGTLTFNILRGGDTTGTVGVNYTTDNSTAQPGVNYGILGDPDEYTRTVSFAPGVTSQPVTIPILADGVVTPDLTFNVSLDTPTGNAALADPNIAKVTIQDMDTYTTLAVLQFDSATYSVAEDGGHVTLNVTRTVNINGTVTVSYSTANGTALAGVNFGTAGDGSDVTDTLTFNSGDTTKQITIPILPDGVYTPDLSFTVELSGNSSNSNLEAPSTATVTITNVDPYVINLEQGWNLISFPVVNTTLKASDLAGTGVYIVASYNKDTGDYDAYNTVSSPSEYDITMSTDIGYFVYCTAETSISVYGPSPSDRSISINPGWNLIGWSSFTSSTAKAVCAQPSLTGVQIIAKYNLTTGDYDAFAEGSSPDEYDFTVHDGAGYFLYTTSAAPQMLYYEVI
ncbi:Calx-beta domain-containing protein [Methanocella paludicola]|nr:Calx-beta domain-containing protein [Methanocella paludicola]